MGVMAAPLVRAARLPAQSGLAFTAAWASGVVANTFLANAWKDGKLTPRELIFSNLMNASLPAFFLHLPTTFFVVYALLGRIAVFYFSLTLIAALLRFGGVILAARMSAESGAKTGGGVSPAAADGKKALDLRRCPDSIYGPAKAHASHHPSGVRGSLSLGARRFFRMAGAFSGPGGVFKNPAA